MYRHNKSLDNRKVNYQGRSKEFQPRAFFQPAFVAFGCSNTLLSVFRPVVFWITFMVTGSSLSGDEFTTGVHAMPDKNSEPLTLELITTFMNEAVRELGTDPDDRRCAKTSLAIPLPRYSISA
jgi:hypothetical protein